MRKSKPASGFVFEIGDRVEVPIAHAGDPYRGTVVELRTDGNPEVTGGVRFVVQPDHAQAELKAWPASRLRRLSLLERIAEVS